MLMWCTMIFISLSSLYSVLHGCFQFQNGELYLVCPQGLALYGNFFAFRMIVIKFCLPQDLMFPPPSKSAPKGLTPITEAKRAPRTEKRPATQAVIKKPKDRGPKWWETIFKDENFKRLVWYEESPEPMRFLKPVSSKRDVDVPSKDAPAKDEPSKKAEPSKQSEPNKKKPKPSREEVVASMVNPGATGEAFYKPRPLSEHADMTTLQDKLESIKDFILQTALDNKRFELTWMYDCVCHYWFGQIGSSERSDCQQSIGVILTTAGCVQLGCHSGGESVGECANSSTRLQDAWLSFCAHGTSDCR